MTAPRITAADLTDRDDDPFQYGWREVPVRGEDGTERWIRKPLTLEEWLHPEEHDFHVNTEQHNDTIRYMVTIFRAQLRHDPHARVFWDLRIKWPDPEVDALGPDIAVVFGVRLDDDARLGTFDVAREGTVPVLVVEVTSPDSRREKDLETKRVLYALVGVEYYVVVDLPPPPLPPTPELFGYRLVRGGYKSMPLVGGRLWLEPLQLWLAVDGSRVICLDRQLNRLGDYNEVLAAREQAERQARAEAAARSEAEARLRALEAELQRLRAERGESG